MSLVPLCSTHQGNNEQNRYSSLWNLHSTGQGRRQINYSSPLKEQGVLSTGCNGGSDRDFYKMLREYPIR